MKKKISNILLIIVFLTGLSLLLYPTVSDYWNSFHASQAVADYCEDVENLDEAQYAKLWNDAVEYNQSLLSRSTGFYQTEEQKAKYNSLLNVNDTGIMGYIEIPNIKLLLPIYHGTDDSVLQVGVGHLDWTSLPVGGEGTHCVISGHRGLPSAKLFTNLDEVVEGDTFSLRVLNDVLTYEVDKILIVEPADADALQIEKGKDYCTLVTCTPYGVNSHRLLIRGHRIETTPDNSSVRITFDAIRIEPLIVVPILALPILFLLLIVIIIFDSKKNNGGENREDKE